METSNLKAAWTMPIAHNHVVMLRCAQLGWKAVRAAGSKRVVLMTHMCTMCNDEILEILDDEHWLLSPVIRDARPRTEMLFRHITIRELIGGLKHASQSADPGSEIIVRLTHHLNELVCWEQRELLPSLEDGLGADQIPGLTRMAAKISSRSLRAARRSNKIRMNFNSDI